jgi:hypothetical protein
MSISICLKLDGHNNLVHYKKRLMSDDKKARLAQPAPAWSEVEV